jgi:hypothetical protein
MTSAGLEPATFCFEAGCSKSIELRSQDNGDKIEMTFLLSYFSEEKVGIEPTTF